ncbi:hypothetical protein MTO96_013791 [Rhipicephalus appendiculatus]
MARAVTFALLVALAALAVVNAQRRQFNFQPPPPRHRFSVEASGGGRNHRNFNVVSHGATRIDGKTYKDRPQGEVGIGVEIPIGKGR